MLKRFNMALIHCRLGFFEMIIAVFYMKTTKISKIFSIFKVLCFFSKYLTDFLDCNAGKVQQRMSVLSNGLLRKIHKVISVKMSQIDTENDKIL